MRFHFFIFISALLLALAIPLQACFALDVTSVRFGAHPDKQRAVIDLSSPTAFRAFVLGAPDRIVIDMDDFAWKAGTVPKSDGISVQDVRFGSLGGGKGRLVFEASQPVTILSAFLLPKQGQLPDRLVVDFKAVPAGGAPEIQPRIMGNMHSSSPEQGYDIAIVARSGIPLPPRKAANRKGFSSGPSSQIIPPPAQKPLIILDPGHGGQDPGAHGANGMYEKTIVLAVAHELRKQLEDSGKYRVKMTRETDVFIPLRGRVNFARQHKGDLFISLHADSIRDSSVTGASVYTLSSTASDRETAKLAERENKSDLIAGIDLSSQEDDIADILIDLATRDTMNQSNFLANRVVGSFRNSQIKTLDTAHRSAGFAVLKAMDIPSVLVEMGYLTNRNEVERLSSPMHRKKIAAALKSSIDAFFQKTSR